MELLEAPNLGPLILAFLALAAFFGGVVDSVAGGGGLITLPATLVAGLPPHMALGTGKFMATLGTSASFLTYARNGVVVWRVAAVGLAFSLTGSVAGSRVALLVDNAILGKVILCLLPVAALLTFMPVRKGGREKTPGRTALYLLTPLICLAVGFYDGFFGPGTGSFILLALHFALGLNLIAASATAKAFNLASNVSSLGVFVISGNVCYAAAIPMALANMAGNILGSRMAIKRGPGLVRRMLLVSLGLLFATLVWRYYSP